MERVEFLRDARHLTGRAATSDAPPPPTAGLAVARGWDDDGAPVLRVARADGAIARLPFRERVRLVVEESSFCVGRVVDGRHVPCPAGRPADRFDQCPACHPLPDRDCVFDPRCVDCTSEFCTGPHEVYLAFYGPHVKVGMTRAARGGGRLIEQGADAWCLAAPAENRKQARDLEERASRILGLPQSVRARAVLPLAARPVPWEAIRANHARLAPRLEALLGVAPGARLPLPAGRGLPLAAPPVPVATIGHHDGAAMGGKGRHLFYEDAAGVLRALDVDRVVTHPVRYHAEDEAAA